MEARRVRRRVTKSGGWAAVAALCAGAAALVPVGGATTHAVTAPESQGLLCSNGTIDPSNGHHTFKLVAQSGYTSEPDGNAIYEWSYGEAAGSFQLPGPVMCVDQGEVIDITLTNTLPVATSVQFPGQESVVAGATLSGLQIDGPRADANGNLTSLALQADPGQSVVYSFTATHAGTYLYESGSDPQLQVQMGLFGAIVVRPRYQDDAGWHPMQILPEDLQAIPGDANIDAAKYQSHAACAYASVIHPTRCDPLAIYDNSRESENILMLSEIDPGLHNYIQQQVDVLSSQAAPDLSKLTWNAYPNAYEAHYFMINGRSMPDTIAPNNAPWLPSQPYGALAIVHPWDVAHNPLDALLRYVAVGVEGYDFHPHSNHEHVIAEDGALMKATDPANPGVDDNNTEEKFNIMVSPGATVDATFRWTNEAGYSDTSGQRVPVAWPQGLNLQEGDFWSGSPYLGNEGQINPGILTKTQCGEYYHVAHSHNLTQVTNYGITFGGMLTLIKVEPPKDLQGLRLPKSDSIILQCNPDGA